MKDTSHKQQTGTTEKISLDGWRIIHTVTAEAFANRRGHGGTSTIVHRQLTRDELTRLLAKAVKRTEFAARKRLLGGE
jgi:hypothetical protein